MSFKNLINFMLPSRNGIDELSFFNLIIVIILMICDIFINNLYLSLSIVLMIIILIWRILSKNIKSRRKENNLYLSIINFPKKKIKLYIDIIKNYDNSLYKRCPKCKQLLKLPLKKGTHTVKCTSCSHKFQVKCNRNERVKAEIVK